MVQKRVKEETTFLPDSLELLLSNVKLSESSSRASREPLSVEISFAGFPRIVSPSVWRLRASRERFSFSFALAGFLSASTVPSLMFATTKIVKNPHSRIISSKKYTKILNFCLLSPLFDGKLVFLHRVLHETQTLVAQIPCRITTSEKENEQFNLNVFGVRTLSASSP